MVEKQCSGGCNNKLLVVMCLAMFLDAARYENTRGRSLGSEAI